MKKVQGNKAASEFVVELANNAEYQSRLDAKRQQAEELALAGALDEREMISELRSAGIAVESVWDFVQIGGAPPTAVSILVGHLTSSHHPRVGGDCSITFECTGT